MSVTPKTLTWREIAAQSVYIRVRKANRNIGDLRESVNVQQVRLNKTIAERDKRIAERAELQRAIAKLGFDKDWKPDGWE